MDARNPTPAAGNEPNGVDSDEQPCDGIAAGLLLEYQSGAAHVRAAATSQRDRDATVSIETSCGNVIVEAQRGGDNELATAGFEVDPDSAERLAAILLEFADHARDDVSTSTHWRYP